MQAYYTRVYNFCAAAAARRLKLRPDDDEGYVITRRRDRF